MRPFRFLWFFARNFGKKEKIPAKNNNKKTQLSHKYEMFCLFFVGIFLFV